MSWVNMQYKSNLRKYEKRDGVKALAVYCLTIGCKTMITDKNWIELVRENEKLKFKLYADIGKRSVGIAILVHWIQQSSKLSGEEI